MCQSDPPSPLLGHRAPGGKKTSCEFRTFQDRCSQIQGPRTTAACPECAAAGRPPRERRGFLQQSEAVRTRAPPPGGLAPCSLWSELRSPGPYTPRRYRLNAPVNVSAVQPLSQPGLGLGPWQPLVSEATEMVPLAHLCSCLCGSGCPARGAPAAGPWLWPARATRRIYRDVPRCMW